MEVLKNHVADLFQSGLNCAQIVLSHFSEKYQLEKSEATKLGCGFGGGARAGELCGAVSGAIMVIGLKYGNDDANNKEAKAECYAKTKEFTTKFKQENGSIVCRELLECDISTKEGMAKAMEQNLFQTRCVDMVVSAIEILMELGY